MHALFPHQQQALDYARPLHQIALFMEMRLGKCAVVIRWAKHHGLQRGLLIAPLSTLAGKQNWQGELAREQVPALYLPGIPKARWPETAYQWSMGAGGRYRRGGRR